MGFSEKISQWVSEQTDKDLDGQYFVQGDMVGQLKKSGKKYKLHIQYGAIKFEEGEPS